MLEADEVKAKGPHLGKEDNDLLAEYCVKLVHRAAQNPGRRNRGDKCGINEDKWEISALEQSLQGEEQNEKRAEGRVSSLWKASTQGGKEEAAQLSLAEQETWRDEAPGDSPLCPGGKRLQT